MTKEEHIIQLFELKRRSDDAESKMYFGYFAIHIAILSKGIYTASMLYFYKKYGHPYDQPIDRRIEGAGC